CQQGFSYPWTF
nr:immunoglobulin light chain junction region [Macaca mulatta]